MSFQASVSGLAPRIKALVLAITQDGTRYVGDSDKDKSEVNDWIEKTCQDDTVSVTKFQELNSLLVPKTYLVNNYLTAADVALYGALHPSISSLQPQQYFSHPALTRYFDHIQSLPPVREVADSLSPPFSPVIFDIANAPKMERKAEQPKKKEKTTKQISDASSQATTQGPSDKVQATATNTRATEKREKEKKPKEAADGSSKKKTVGGGAKATQPEDAGEPVPSMIDLRVGHIVDVIKHPDADGLYIEQIDLGEETGPRTVVSGLVNYIPIEEMRDKYLVAVCNLKPANMRGVKSFAMVLCATSRDGKEGGIELIQPPPNSKPGDRVYFEGPEFESSAPLSQLNPKKKIFETIQPGFITLDTKQAAWVNPTTKSVHRIRTKDGNVTILLEYGASPNTAKHLFSLHPSKKCEVMVLRLQLSSVARCFSTTARAQAHLSHIGREPIKVPAGVTLNTTQTAMSIAGPLGTTSVPLKPFVKISFPEPSVMSVGVEDAGVKEQRQMWGTTRTLISNAITGITEGFTVPLYLVGVGYRAAIEDDPRGKSDVGGGQRLSLKLGQSHTVYVPIPPHIKAQVPYATKIVLSCTDKHQLGLFAAKIREWRKPEPYKGKGVFVGREQIRIKSAKKK
ncbi:hypothetical protein AX17_005222 [Amanita inopinata Kibby_2008]|nr:hypothetical protein AX17_005222 [Amanita inopinata Kibby_2008]